MVKRHALYLDQIDTFFSCVVCHSQIITQNDIVSRAFQGRDGPAYLVEDTINISIGKPEERMLLTGLHIVADISCNICKTKVGWQYLETPRGNQAYKEGKFIVEKSKIIKELSL
ncbi:hypothetical protein K501DRAFT_299017 [Backusella circina FSU 941]|nr:hypothetical protein K501DRAFT_299017 [Backusella circina FSU 941]